MVGERVGEVDVLGEAGGEFAVEDVEVRSADGDVVRRGAEAIDGETLIGDVLGIGVVAPGGAAVSGGDGDGDALRGSLLPEVLNVLVAGGSLYGFATAEADVEDVGLVVVERALDGEEEAGVERGVGCGIEDDVCAGSDAAGDFGVEVGFDGVPFSPGSVPSTTTVRGLATTPKVER